MTGAMRAKAMESEEELEPILDTVRRRTGLTLPPRTAPMGAIRREMRYAHVSNPAEYVRLLTERSEAFDSLVTALTVGETYFLREREQLEFIRDTVIPGLRATSGATMKAWSAGCANGEEAYSLAIMADAADAGIRVLGTDISTLRLERARTATYGEWSFRGVSPEIRARYFSRAHDRFEVIPAIRSQVEFRSLNLAAADWPAVDEFGPFDLVLCRNTLIYLDAPTVARVARRLMASLTPFGWLFLGASDPILSGLVPCEIVLTGSGIAYRPAAPRFRSQSREAPVIAIGAASAERTAAPRVPPEPARERQPASVSARPGRYGSPIARATNVTVATGSAADAYSNRDYSTAAELARAQVAREPEDPAAWVTLVRALANLGRLEEAGRACAAAHDLHRNSAEITYLHGLLLREGGHMDDAAAALRAAVYLDRQLAIAHLTLGDLLASNGETESALRAFRNTDRLLARMPADEPVVAADGLRAGTLRQLTRGRMDYWGGRRDGAESADA